MKTNLLRLLAIFTLLAIFSCTKDNPEWEYQPDKKVIVINQGNFTEHSASISIYDEQTGQIQNRVYESVNGVSIGATIISGLISPQMQLMLVCNYPDKIEIADARTMVALFTPITEGLANPRNAVIDKDRLYVTNWDYDYIVNDIGFWEFHKSYVAVYDLNTRTLIKKVAVGTDAEGILFYDSKLYIALKEGVKVLNTTNDLLNTITVIKPANVSGGAKYLALDKQNKIWASFPDRGLVKIDPAYNAALGVVDVPVDYMDGYISPDGTGERILTYNTTFNSSYMPEEAGIYAVDTGSGSVSKIFSGIYFYGVGASPFTGNIYTAEVNFTSNSLMKIVKPNGTLSGTAVSGVGTSRYLFF